MNGISTIVQQSMASRVHRAKELPYTEQMLQALRDRGPMTAKELAAVIGVRWGLVSDYLRRDRVAGRVTILESRYALAEDTDAQDSRIDAAILYLTERGYTVTKR